MPIDIKPRAYTTTNNDAHQPVGAIEHQPACVATLARSDYELHHLRTYSLCV
jgi:hypothetical protein